MKFYSIEPNVPGALGPGTELDTTSHPPKVVKLNFELHGWPLDPISECFPIFLVKAEAKNRLESRGMTGISFSSSNQTLSDEFVEIYSDKIPEELIWMHVNGVAFNDDFGISDENILVISQNALDIFESIGLNDAIITPIG